MFKKRLQEREQTKLERRASSLPTVELVPWVERSLLDIGRYLSAWQKTGAKAYLDEANAHSNIISTLMRELDKRSSL
ncbi:MAG: hypothetical protein EBY26_00315 [Microbacteriaceae bacterium]|nr:hypothetical protein [Microbacteriaceae bacterium]